MTLATNIQTVIDSGNQINEAFPIAGQDNNTQGFRDNFSKTQIGLQAAGNSLLELNTRTVKKDVDNDFTNIGSIQNSLFLNNKGITTEVTVNTTASIPVHVYAAEYIRIKIADDYVNGSIIHLNGWPTLDSNAYRKVRIEIYQPNNLTRYIKFGGDGTYETIKYNDAMMFDPNGSGLEITGDSVIIDAWVSDYSNNTSTGKTIYLQYVGTFTAP